MDKAKLANAQTSIKALEADVQIIASLPIGLLLVATAAVYTRGQSKSPILIERSGINDTILAARNSKADQAFQLGRHKAIFRRAPRIFGYFHWRPV